MSNVDLESTVSLKYFWESTWETGTLLKDKFLHLLRRIKVENGRPFICHKSLLRLLVLVSDFNLLSVNPTKSSNTLNQLPFSIQKEKYLESGMI